MSKTWRIAGVWIFSALMSSLLVAAPEPVAAKKTAAVPGKPAVGWRQNWTGRFPDAQPPVTWGRMLQNSIVKGLKIQNKKPTGDKPDASAASLADGYPTLFLVAGPFDPTDAAKAMDQEFVAKEADVQPSDGDKIGDKAWKAVLMDRELFVHTDSDPMAYHLFLGPIKQGQVAYAFSYIHSERAGKVRLMLDHVEGLKLWVNGKLVHNNLKTSVAFSFWGGQRELLQYWAPGVSQVVEIDLVKGWNRFMFKTVAGNWEWARNAGFRARFKDIPPVSYVDKNIAWVANLPDRSNSNPILVGDRIYLMAERDSLLCYSKKDGKLLWQRTNNYYDALTESEKKVNPAYAELEPIAAKLRNSLDWDERLNLTKQLNEGLLKIDSPKFEMKVESHPAGHWELTGWTTPTPCSDGKHIYIWLTSGVAACYDLDGNRKWIKRIDEIVKNPKDQWGPYNYPHGCAIVGDKFILNCVDTFALNASTGDVAWRQPTGLGLCIQPATFNSTPAVIGKYVALRVSDGKVLWKNPQTLQNCAGSVFADDVLFVPGESVGIYDFNGVSGEELKPASRGSAVVAPEQNRHRQSVHFKAGDWKDIYIFTAPLIHDGLVYQVDSDGMLYVVDVKTGQLVYRKLLDLEPLVSVRTCGVCSAVTLGGKYIYIMDNQGVTLVLEPGRTYKQVARNKIETPLERPNTGKGWQEWGPYGAPVFEGKNLYIRMERNLYCIAEK